MPDLVFDKGEQDFKIILHCAINLVNQVMLLPVSGNSLMLPEWVEIHGV